MIVIRFNKSILVKMLSGFILIIIISLGLVMFMWQRTVTEIIYSNVDRQLHNSFDRANDYFYEILEENELRSAYLAVSLATKDLLVDEFDNAFVKMNKLNEFENIARGLLSDHTGVVGISLIGLDAVSYMVGDSNIYPNAPDELWFQETLAVDGKVHYFYYDTDKYKKYMTDGEVGCCSFARAIKVNDQVLGVLVFDISEDLFNEAFAYVEDSHNKIILLNREDSPAYMYNTSISELDEILASREEESLILGDTEYRFMKHYRSGDWTLIPMAAVDLAVGEEIGLIQQIILYSTLILIAAIVLSALISRSITGRIRVLRDAMRRVRKDNNLDVKISFRGEDEISVLADYFTDMMSDINELIGKIKAKEAQKRALELKSLQSQIRPHFTYNTLNTIIYLSELNGSTNIEEVTRALIDLLRAAAKNDRQTVTINEELLYVRSYLKIQEYKYMGQFETFFDIDEDALEHEILKFILQPIVENCLIHGSDKKKVLQIHIRVKTLEDWLWLEVEDNGVGMSEERVRQVLNSSTDHEDSIGIQNTIERLSYLYNEQYQFELVSQEGHGTLVRFGVPLSN